MSYHSRIESAFSPAKETFETLWLSLLRKESQHQRFFIASVHGGDGATTVAACAAIGLARHLSEPVVLIEANIKNPGLAFQMSLPGAPGFVELMRGEAPLEDVTHGTGVPGLSCVCAGGPNAGSLGGNRRLQEILGELEHEYRVIVFDAGPILPYSDSSLLLQYVDEAILVASAGKTRDQDILKAAQIISASETPLVGTVLNFYRKEVPTWVAAE
ncbi:MAG: CpsD/CapB family tyrosine-protein kinase [Planctomycetes bacterium]|nr:CpsD/CapB family tyrosine-protein kinase [Planctomycetota bacterium]